MACSGNTSDHCCYIDEQPCRFLEENTVPGRRWACGLYRRLGAWEAVYVDPAYVAHVQPFWTREGERLGAQACGDWPSKGHICATCGVSDG